MAKQDYSIDVGMWAERTILARIQRGIVCLVIICLLFLSSLETWGKWELKLRGGRWDRSINLVHFITPKQGWAVGGTSFWTEDGGETWTRRDLDIWPTAFFLNALDGWQPSKQSYYLIKGAYPPVDLPFPFLRSYDGGLSWQEITGKIVEVFEANRPPRPEDVYRFSIGPPLFYFLDSQTGFAAGTTGLFGGMPDTSDAFRAYYIAKTTDGGKTWMLYLHWGNWTWLGGHAREIEFFDAQHGWVLTVDQVLYRTQDGGQTWQH